MFKIQKLLLLSGLTGILLGGCSERKTERFLVGGCGWDQVAVVNKASGLIEWSHQLNPEDDCNAVSMTRNGDVLYAYKAGARLISYPDQSVIWDYRAPADCEVYTATEMKNGRYLIAMCGSPARIIELETDGNPVSEITFDTGIEDIHSQFRQLVKTENERYIIPIMGHGEVIEMDAGGEIHRRIEVGGNPFSVKILSSGNWLVSCGDGHKLAEVNPRTQETRTIHSDDIPGADLLFVAEALPCENGNLLITNWPGHTSNQDQPRILEIDPEGKIVWELKSTPENGIGFISAVYRME